jgi:hypothetical protein
MTESALARGILAAVLVASAACAGGPRERPIKTDPINEGPGSLTVAREYLKGRWELLSFEVYPPGKKPIFLKGGGELNYDDFGNLKMEVQADQSSADLLRAEGIQMRDGSIVSDGRTVIDLQNKTLTYVIEGQPPTATGPLSMQRPRHWQVDKDVLTLTTKDDAGKPLSVARWKKIPDKVP